MNFNLDDYVRIPINRKSCYYGDIIEIRSNQQVMIQLKYFVPENGHTRDIQDLNQKFICYTDILEKA